MSVRTIKVSGKGMHTFPGLLGYVQKDSKLEHYQLRTKGVTEAVSRPAAAHRSFRGNSRCTACMLWQRLTLRPRAGGDAGSG